MGNSHTLAINAKNEIYAWGGSTDGQLGDRTTIDRYEPISGGLNITAVAAGSRHSSLASNFNVGLLYTFGNNQYGQIGDGTTSSTADPFPLTFVACPTSTLPVELVYFNARKDGETSALLTWKTAQEMNASHYEVQRSTDAIHYSFLGKVTGQRQFITRTYLQFYGQLTLAGRKL